MTKIAVVGCGHWGKNHVRNYSELGALAAVCDPREEIARQFSEQYDVPAKSFDSVLADDDVDGVALCTPAELHAEMAIAAFGRGKNVFVEKPIALSLSDAETMIEASERANRVLMVGHILRYHPAFIALEEFVRSGGIGDLRYAYSHRASLGKFRTEENAGWSFAPHDVSMLLALFGEEPSEVNGTGQDYVTPGVDDFNRMDLRFSGGRTAHIFASWLHPFKEHRLTVVGESGMAVFEDSAQGTNKLRLYKHEIDNSGPVPVPHKVDFLPIPYGDAEPLKSQLKHFVECIETGSTPRTDGREAMRVLRALLSGMPLNR